MKRVWHFITALKNAIGNLFFVLIVGAVIFALFSQQSVSVPESAVMIIDPEGTIVEQERALDPVQQFLSGDSQEDPETLGRNVVEAIELAAEDDRIKAIALDLSKLSGSTMNQYDAIGKALHHFKERNKQVFAFGVGYSQSQYYLASFADQVYVDQDSMQTLGGVFLQGFGAYPIYVKSALEKLHVNMHVIKAGTYKDAAEMYQRDDMSEYSRESNQEWVDFLWDSYLSTIAEQRDIEKSSIVEYINNYDSLLENVELDPAQLAIDHGLIDKKLSRSQWREEMQEIAGDTGDTYQHIDYRSYLNAVRPPIPVVDPTSDKVAVIIAKGTILDGDQPSGDVGGDSVAQLIRRARNSDDIKAIVLRIDSPGGSPSASELIRTELAATQASGKPVVASMGGYAASGGYWIASTANKIFAAETSITGSIGVVATFPTFENTLKQIGVHSDGVGTTNLSGSFNSLQEINPHFKKVLESSVRRTYSKFLSLVSEGRGLTLEEADSVAQGRVWTGARALEHDLIDAIGDLDDAVKSAAVLADVSNYDVIYLEKQLTPKEQLIKELLQVSVSVLPALPTNFSKLIQPEISALLELVREPGVYLQCMSCRITF